MSRGLHGNLWVIVNFVEGSKEVIPSFTLKINIFHNVPRLGLFSKFLKINRLQIPKTRDLTCSLLKTSLAIFFLKKKHIARASVCFNMKVYARINMQTRKSLNWIMSEKLAVLKMNILFKIVSCIICFIVHFLKTSIICLCCCFFFCFACNLQFAKQQRSHSIWISFRV